MNLHVVAYPQLSRAAYERIQEYRRYYNSLFSVIAPHFTIVFSVTDFSSEAFIEEIKDKVKGTLAIPFCLRCTTINKDAFSNNYDAFLVPDEGHSGIMKLHDRLYAGKLARHHRLDIPYVPHISIANAADALVTKRIVDEWNADVWMISGSIAALDVVNYENRIVTTLERIPLAEIP